MGNSEIANFLSKSGIYHEHKFCEKNENEILFIFDQKAKYPIDMQCPYCKKDTVFYICGFETYENYTPEIHTFGASVFGGSDSFEEYKKSQTKKYLDLLKSEPVVCLTAYCARDALHIIHLFVKLETDKITKVGQYPNVKLTLYPNVNKYQKLLNDYFIELKTALILYSNSVGVGSYVYLRRVFEKIILDKYNEHKSEIEISEIDFFKLRMEEKVDSLKNFLPEFIVQNKNIYSILSKGVHELDEDECLKYFDTIEQSIEMILDEILERKSKQEKQKALTGLIANVTGTLKKQGGDNQ